MERHDQHPGEFDHAVEQTLLASRPEPDPAFVGALEERLLDRAPVRERRWFALTRPLFAGAAAAAAMAGVALALSLAGAGPLAPGGGDSLEAKDDCRMITVKRPERVPFIVERDGRPEIRFRQRLVERRVERCS